MANYQCTGAIAVLFRFLVAFSLLLSLLSLLLILGSIQGFMAVPELKASHKPTEWYQRAGKTHSP